MESINRIEKKRVIVALFLATFMISGALIAIAPTAKAQVEDAKFIGKVTIGASPASDTLVMYALGTENYPLGNSTVTNLSGDYEIWVEGGYTYWLYFANGEAMFDTNAQAERSIGLGETVTVNTSLTPAPARTATLMGYATNASNPSEAVTTGHVLGMKMITPQGMPEYMNWTVTNSTGYYEMNLVPGAIMTAIFDAEGYYPTMAGTENPLILGAGESGWINISLFPYGAGNVNVTGNVTDYSTHLPIENALVEAMLYEMPFSEDNYTNSTGGYSLTVIEGEGTMIVSATGYTMLRENEIDFSGNMTKDFELHQINCRVYGYILDELTLTPISNATVSANSWLGGNRELWNETTSGPGGYYEMNLSDGEWDIWAEANGYGRNGTHATLNPMDNLLVNISLSPENSVFKGYVRDNETGNPIGGVTVAIGENPGDMDNSTLTNASGYFEMYCVPGNYSFLFYPMSGYMYEIQIFNLTEINQSETKWVNRSLEPATTELHGTVTDMVTHDPLSGVDIRAMHMIGNNSGFVRAAMGSTDISGNYSIMVAPNPETYLMAFLEDYKDYNTMLDIPDVSAYEWNFTMEPIVPPIVNAFAIPDSNVSTMNHADLYAEVIESNLSFFMLRLCNIIDLETEYVLLQELEWYGFDPGNPGASDLNGIEVSPGVWEIGLYDWDTNDTYFGGLSIIDSSGKYILTANYWYNGAGNTYHVDGQYENSSMGSPSGCTAVFDDSSGELIGIDFGSGPDANAAADPTGVFWQVLWNLIEYDLLTNEVDDWWAMADSPTLQTSTMYLDNPGVPLTYPTGNYSAMFTAEDDSWTETNNISLFMIDNTPPIADAGAGQNTLENMIVTLDGSGSMDNIGIVNYTWEFVDDSTAITLYGITAQYTFEIAGNYSILLTVRDGANLTDSNSTYVQVNADTEPPVANAGANQTVDAGDEVIFNGSGSTDNVGIVNYTWTFTDGTAQTLYGISPHYTFANLGTFIVMLDVTDEANLSDTDNVTITVNDTTIPSANAGLDQTVDEDTLVTFDGSGSSDNVGIVNYTWTFTDGTQKTLYGVSPTYTFETPGTYNVTLNVTDAASNWDTDEVTITVEAEAEEDTTSPTADAGSNQNVSAGTVVTFDGSGSTDNVGVVNYTWAFVYEGNAKTLYGVALTFEFDAAGVYEVTLTVRDAANLTDTDTVTITVNEPEEDAITSFLTEYWWIIVAAVVIAAASVAAYMMMKGGKGGKKPSAPETKPEPEQIEEEILPPPPDD